MHTVIVTEDPAVSDPKTRASRFSSETLTPSICKTRSPGDIQEIVEELDPKKSGLDSSLLHWLPAITADRPPEIVINGEKHIVASSNTSLGLGVAGLTVNHIGEML